jgi:phage baseplate assembly protein W
MLRDIYLRNEDDPLYIENKMEENDNIKDLVEQLKMLFATSPGEVIAHPFYGLNLEDMLFEFDFEQDEILQEIDRQYFEYIGPYFPGVNVEFNVYVSEGEISRTMIIDVYINNELNFQLTT